MKLADKLREKIEIRAKNDSLRSLMLRGNKVDFFSNDYLGVAQLKVEDNEISLNTADAANLLAVYESTNTSAPQTSRKNLHNSFPSVPTTPHTTVPRVNHQAQKSSLISPFSSVLPLSSSNTRTTHPNPHPTPPLVEISGFSLDSSDPVNLFSTTLDIDPHPESIGISHINRNTQLTTAIKQYELARLSKLDSKREFGVSIEFPNLFTHPLNNI